MQKTVFITGATSGFGLACARRFAAEGQRIIICGRRSERLAALEEELKALVPVLSLILDVRDRQSVAATIADLPTDFNEVDVLVNNAGLALGLEPAHQANLDDWENMVDTNIKGLLYCTRLLLPGMVEREKGHIINIGSVAGNWPYPGGNTYGATKAFVRQFSLNLRADLIGTPIRVTNIEPGIADTEFSVVRFKGDEAKAAKVYEGTKALTADDIADIVVWVNSVPDHVNINTLEVMPTLQSWGPFAIHRE
ncbi:MAG: SDR family oxidoreductase [Desulfobulbaceae bacterium]|nr:SDR family oxidoreductase [Desulfobulbaceae bacterium]